MSDIQKPIRHPEPVLTIVCIYVCRHYVCMNEYPETCPEVTQLPIWTVIGYPNNAWTLIRCQDTYLCTCWTSGHMPIVPLKDSWQTCQMVCYPWHADTCPNTCWMCRHLSRHESVIQHMFVGTYVYECMSDVHWPIQTLIRCLHTLLSI